MMAKICLRIGKLVNEFLEFRVDYCALMMKAMIHDPGYSEGFHQMECKIIMRCMPRAGLRIC